MLVVDPCPNKGCEGSVRYRTRFSKRGPVEVRCDTCGERFALIDGHYIRLTAAR